MAVALDAVGPSSSGYVNKTTQGTSPATWTHVVGASATALLVWVSFDGWASGNPTVSVTAGGTAMTAAAANPVGNGGSGNASYAFTLLNPPTGSITISVTFTTGGAGDCITGGSLSFTGAGGFGTPVSFASGVSGTATLTCTGVASTSMVAGFIGCGDPPVSPSTGTNQFQALGEGSSGSTNGNSEGATNTGSGSVSVIWSTLPSGDSNCGWAVEVQASGGSLGITTTSLPAAATGLAYSQTLAASGGTSPYTWSISSGALPGWASLNTSTGAITGTPAAGQAGSSFTVKVTDSASNTATQALTIGVQSQVTLVGSVGTTSGTASPLTGVYGQTPTAGNLLLAVLSAGSTTAETANISTSTSGWSRLTTGTVGNNPSGTSDVMVDAWVKTAVGGDAAPSFTQTLGATGPEITCRIFELAGANTTTPLDVSAVYQSGSATGTVTFTLSATPAAYGEFAVDVMAQQRGSSSSLTWTETGTGWTSNGKLPSGTAYISTQANYQAAPAPVTALSDAGHFSITSASRGAGLMVVIAGEPVTAQAVLPVISAPPPPPATPATSRPQVITSPAAPAPALPDQGAAADTLTPAAAVPAADQGAAADVVVPAAAVPLADAATAGDTLAVTVAVTLADEAAAADGQPAAAVSLAAADFAAAADTMAGVLASAAPAVITAPPAPPAAPRAPPAQLIAFGQPPAHPVTLAEVAGAADALTVAVAAPLADPAAAADALAAAAAVPLAEAAAAADTAQAAAAVPLPDAAAAADTAASLIAGIAPAVVAAPVPPPFLPPAPRPVPAQVIYPGGAAVSPADQAAAADLLTVQQAGAPAYADPAAAADTLTGAASAPSADLAAAAGALTAAASSPAAEAAAAAETLTAAVAAPATETAAAAEQLAVAVTQAAALSDAAAADDTTQAAAAVPLPELAAAADTPAAAAATAAAELAAAADTVTVATFIAETGHVTWAARPAPPRWHAAPAPARWHAAPEPARWAAGPEPSRWQATPAPPRWKATLMNFAPIAAVSLEEVNVNWTADLAGTSIDPTGQTPGQPQLTVQVAFPVSSGNPQAPAQPVTWYAAGWLDGTNVRGYIAQCLTGPGGGQVTLTAGMSYDVWSWVQGTPESPKKYAGTLEVY